MKQQGFTLIELMIVVVMIGILAMVAIPAYNNSVQKSRRTDAYNALTKLQLEMEKYRGNCSLYPSSLVTTGDDCSAQEISYTDASDEAWYGLAIVSATGNAYQLRATADANGPQKDDKKTGVYDCTVMTITVSNANPKGAKAPADCW